MFHAGEPSGRAGDYKRRLRGEAVTVEYSKVLLQFLFSSNPQSPKLISYIYTDRATKCHPFGKIFVKPEVFPIDVSQTESPMSTPKVVV